MLEALSFTAQTVVVGGTWTVRVLTTDTDTGAPTAPTLTATVTLPDGSVGSVTFSSTTVSGVFRVLIGIEDVGRHILRVDDGVDVVAFVAQGVSLTEQGGMPDVTELDDYLDEHSWTDAQLQQVLDQETAAQARVCRIPAAYPADLRGALLRRAQVALAMKAISLGMIQPADGDPSMVPGNDPQVRRLEKPWRKVVIG